MPLFIVVLLALLVPPGVSGRDGGPPPVETHRKSLVEIMEIRSVFGLRNDEAFVDSVDGAESSLLGIPLTASEEAEMNRRARIQESLTPLEAYAATIPDVFGGVFIDQSVGGTVDIALTPQASSVVSEHLRAIAPGDANIRLRTVSFAKSELDIVHSELERMAALEPNGGRGGIGAISTSVQRNVVQVEVAPKDRPALEPVLKAAFGARVTVVDESQGRDEVCNTRTSCTPYRAGIQLYPPGSSAYCTSGFMSKKPNNTYFLLTAGHCGPLNSAWNHDEVQVGLVKIRAYANGGKADADAISRAGTAGHKNWIFVTAGEPARTVTARQGQNGDTVGESVCLSGVSSGFWCGVLQDDDVDNVTINGVTMNNLRGANYGSTGGDSGSPIFYGHLAKGLHKGQAFGMRIYSHVWEVEQALGVTVLVAPT